MACNNFVCAFSYPVKGKMYCQRNSYSYDCKELPDCSATMENYCNIYKYFSCKICGHDVVCNIQHANGIFYSPEKGFYTPSSSTEFAKAVKQNELINAKRDIYATACSNYRQGYKISTTIRQLYQRYGKKFPQFTKEFLDKAVHLSIIKYLETEE